MREFRLRTPLLFAIAATRGLLGVGLGLLLAGKIGRDKRVAAGCTLATIGLASTVPLAIQAFRKRRELPTNGAPVAS